MAIDRRKHNRM